MKKRILEAGRQLENTDSVAGKRNDLQKKIFNDERELDRLRDKSREKQAMYAQHSGDSSTLSINNLRHDILNDRSAFIEILAGDALVYIIIVSNKNSWLRKIEKAQFETLAAAYESYISQPDLVNRDFAAFVNISHNLYELLLQDIQLEPGRIIISSDGKYFPFEALVTSMQPLIYFLEDHAVSYTYSARYLLTDFARNSSAATKAFLGIAPFRITNGLSALEGSDRSLSRIQNYFDPSLKFVGSEASKSNFLKTYYNYRIIQCYTHATDSGYRSEPMIYFSDSALSLSDLFYENKLATELIVLSACVTARGKVYGGEGVFSFNRQFASLGIPSAIVNLWSVENESTYRLTEFFYKYLSQGMTADVALQKAKLEFIKTGSKKYAAVLLGGTYSCRKS